MAPPISSNDLESIDLPPVRQQTRVVLPRRDFCREENKEARGHRDAAYCVWANSETSLRSSGEKPW